MELNEAWCNGEGRIQVDQGKAALQVAISRDFGACCSNYSLLGHYYAVQA